MQNHGKIMDLILGNRWEPCFMPCHKTRFHFPDCTITHIIAPAFQISGQVKDLDEVIHELEKKRDAEAGGVMEKLETAVGEKQKEEVKAKSALSNKTDTLKAEQKKLKQLNKQLENVRVL